MKVLESAQNYLETILILKRQQGEIRAVDIANHLNFSKPSVSNAMKQLIQNNYIHVNPSGYIGLTKKGFEIAAELYERHDILSDFFISIGVQEDVAREDACKIEHHISKECFEKIKSHYLANKESMAD